MFLELTGKLGSKAKAMEQQNYYFVKLLASKRDKLWSNEFVGIWLIKKKEVGDLLCPSEKDAVENLRNIIGTTIATLQKKSLMQINHK
jgi:hypothetical protein